MLTALSFAHLGISSTIIESKSTKDKAFFNDVRTTALTAYSVEILSRIGIWDKIKKIAGSINDIYVVDNKAPQMLHFNSSDIQPDKKMGYLVENTKFKKLLFELTSTCKLIKIIDQTEYNNIDNLNENCILTLNNQTEIPFDLLIVCDGRNSRAKQLFFSPYIEKDYKQDAITFITHHEKPHEGTAIEHFMPSGPFAILPLKSANHSSIVWTVSKEKSGALMSIAKEEFVHLVQQNFGQFLGEIKIQGEISVFPLKSYATKKYYNNKIVLVADTAHIIHPLAGQGLNQGIKDIETLTDLVSKYGACKQTFILYEKARLHDNLNMLAITDAINLVFSNDSKLFHCVRQVGFKAIEAFSPVKKMLVEYAMGKRK